MELSMGKVLIELKALNVTTVMKYQRSNKHSKKQLQDGGWGINPSPK